jgi:hypothetical protein
VAEIPQYSALLRCAATTKRFGAKLSRCWSRTARPKFFGPDTIRRAHAVYPIADPRPAAVKNFLAHTLTRLGLDHIDIYRPARLDPAVPTGTQKNSGSRGSQFVENGKLLGNSVKHGQITQRENPKNPRPDNGANREQKRPESRSAEATAEAHRQAEGNVRWLCRRLLRQVASVDTQIQPLIDTAKPAIN